MASEIVQSQYERLSEISKRFAKQADTVQQMHTQLNSKLHDLEAGAWQGRGSQAFFGEMHQLVLPASTKLQQALAEAERVTLQIVKIMQEAEREAANPFQGSQAGVTGAAGAAGNGASNGAAATTGDGVAGAAGGGAAGGGAPAAGGNGSTSSRDLLAKDPSQLFTGSYMESLIGSRFKGENTAELNQLSEDLYKAVKADPANTAEVGKLLDRMADLRGVDRETFHAQYQTYRQLLENAHRTGGVLPNIDLQKHGDFLGTTVALRYGKVVGDAFGIDPVFGSLLNPTGGLVGPGDTSYQPSANDAIGYHGVVHDAAGYLYNAHGLGPGYDYLGRDILPTSSPLSGQVGGISWWMAHPQLEVDILPNVVPDIPFVPRFVEQGVAEVVEGGIVRVARMGSAYVEGGGSVVDGVRDVFRGDFREGLGDIASGGGTIVKGIGRSFIDLFD